MTISHRQLLRAALVIPITLATPFISADEKPAVEQPKPEAPARPGNTRPNVGLLNRMPRVPENVQAFKNIEYSKPGNTSQTLDIYVPKNATGKLPLIVWIHGGGWISGSKENCPAIEYSTRGYVVASINYRLTGTAIFPSQIIDCKAAIRFLRANADTYHIDSDHVGVWGSSAGGHLSALVGTTGNVKEFDQGDNLKFSSKVQAVMDFFGPTDFLQMDPHAVPGARMKHNIADSPESKLVGGLISEKLEEVKKANPITYVGKDTPPFYIAHGDKDPLVSPYQSQLMHDALKAASVPVDLYWVKGAGHGGAEFFNKKELTDQVAAFWEKHLKVPAAK